MYYLYKLQQMNHFVLRDIIKLIYTKTSTGGLGKFNFRSYWFSVLRHRIRKSSLKDSLFKKNTHSVQYRALL